MIPSHQRQLWEMYCACERRRIRAESLLALNRFIDSMLELPDTVWHEWILNVAERVVDQREEIEVRVPFFRSLMFPALRNGLREARPGCARWLAEFSQQLYQSPSCQMELPEEQRTEIGLLRTAIAHDTNDSMSRHRLIDALAYQLENAIHEVPAGVLWGNDGASVDQCRELREELDEFCVLTDVEKSTADHEDLIALCQLHFNAYPDYLTSQGEYTSYADFLGAVYGLAPAERASRYPYRR